MLKCNDCGKEKEEVIYSPYEEKPIPRCEDCHYAAMIKNDWGKTPEDIEAAKLRKLENLKKARAAMKAKREAKKEVQEGTREIVE